MKDFFLSTSATPLDSDFKFATEFLICLKYLKMKKIIICTLLFSFTFISLYSQSNNPFDSEGINFVRNALYIKAEMIGGKIASASNNVIEKYNRELNIGDSAIVSQITTNTFQTVTAPNFNLNTFLENSSLPLRLKAELISIIDAAQNNIVDNFKSFLTNKVTSISENTSFEADEKIAILKLCSIAYHSTEIQTIHSNNNNTSNFYPVENPGPQGTILGCMGAGFAIGYTIGGNVGGAIGAGVGFIVGLCIEIS